MGKMSVLALVYLAMAVFAVFLAGTRLMDGMWLRGMLMAFVAAFCSYRFYTLYEGNESG